MRMKKQVQEEEDEEEKEGGMMKQAMLFVLVKKVFLSHSLEDSSYKDTEKKWARPEDL